MKITAVVLSKDPVTIPLPRSLKVVNHCETFTTTGGIHAARRRAMRKVETERFFFMDSDDTLPDDIESVLEECMESKTGLVFTDEMIITDKDRRRTNRSNYTLRGHAIAPLWVHHLALVDTAKALVLLSELPSGEYWFEQLLYFELARTAGATHVPRVGYNWHRGDGMNRAKGILTAQVKSASWCYRRLNP